MSVFCHLTKIIKIAEICTQPHGLLYKIKNYFSKRQHLPPTFLVGYILATYKGGVKERTLTRFLILGEQILSLCSSAWMGHT